MLYHNLAWLLNTSPANLTKNVPQDFFEKKVVSAEPFSAEFDAVSYFQNKP